MANTQIEGTQILDSSIGRVDLNTTTVGNAVIRKVVSDASGVVLVNSTGIDTGTGDVTIGVDLTYLNTKYPSLITSRAQNNFLATPFSGSGAPTWRTIVSGDIPTLNQNTTGNATNVTGTVAIANGGTGSATQNFVDLLTTQSISGAKTFNNPLIVSINTADALPAELINTSSTGYGLKVRGGNTSRYSLQVSDYANTSLFNISTSTGANLSLPLMVNINTADALPAELNNLSSTGYGLKIRGGNGSRYGLQISDYNNVSQLNISSSTGATFGVPVIASSFTKSGGTSSQFLKADGSVDGSTYITASALSTYAPLASPALTGSPTAPTQTAGDNSTKIATTAYVDATMATSATSGTYTPTFTVGTNTSSGTPYSAGWTRVGNQVIVHGSVDVTASTTFAVNFSLSLPITSYFSAYTDCNGTGSSTDGDAESVYVIGSLSTSDAVINYRAISATSTTLYYTYQYTIKEG